MNSGRSKRTRLSREVKKEMLSILANVKEHIVTTDRSAFNVDEVQLYSDNLTPREREVLRQVALGMNNPEIAQELFISLNTVARHMTNIFSKTNTTNRVEAALYAARHGIG